MAILLYVAYMAVGVFTYGLVFGTNQATSGLDVMIPDDIAVALFAGAVWPLGLPAFLVIAASDEDDKHCPTRWSWRLR